MRGGRDYPISSIQHFRNEVLSVAYSSNPALTGRSQKLRREMTKEERHLWYDFLKHLSIPFHRQKTIGCYIVDFFCDSAGLVIELDGSQHFEETGAAEDTLRDKVLAESGYTVLRYANSDINRNFRGVCQDILSHLPAGTKWRGA